SPAARPCGCSVLWTLEGGVSSMVTGDDGDPRPWEEAGVVRRDCEIHRGPALFALALGALAFGVLGNCLGLPVLWSTLPPPLVAPFLLPALALSGGVLWGARRDLARMRQGILDPAGRDLTLAAATVAACQIALGLGVLAVCSLTFVVVTTG